MATLNYHVAGTIDLSQAASWKSATGGAGAVPTDATADVAYFTEGSDIITGGLSTAAVDLDNIKINRGFTGRIGGTGAPWIIGVNNAGSGGTTGVFEYGAGGGACYLQPGTNGIDILRVNGAGHLYLVGGTPALIEQYSGEMDLNDSVDLSGKTVYLFGGLSTHERKADGTDPTYNVGGGSHYIKRPTTAINIYGGNVVLDITLETVGSVTVNHWGGMLDLRAGGITTYNAFGGEYTAENATRDLTIATTNVYNARARSLQGRGARITYTTVNLKGAADAWR